MNKYPLYLFAFLAIVYGIVDLVSEIDIVDGKLCVICATIFFTGAMICDQIEQLKK